MMCEQDWWQLSHATLCVKAFVRIVRRQGLKKMRPMRIAANRYSHTYDFKPMVSKKIIGAEERGTDTLITPEYNEPVYPGCMECKKAIVFFLV